MKLFKYLLIISLALASPAEAGWLPLVKVSPGAQSDPVPIIF